MSEPQEFDDLDDAPEAPDLLLKWYNEYKDQSYPKLAARMLVLAKEAKAADDNKIRLNKELDVIRLKVVPERFLKDEVKSMNITGIGRLGLTKDAYCLQPKETQEDLYTFLKENGYPDIVKETVNPSSLKSIVKELEQAELEKEVEFDPSAVDDEEESLFDRICKLVKYTPFMRASVTKK
ncbi:hypothetical protein D3C76_163790 [compost metagenome]